MHVLDFLADLQNTEVSVTLLKSDCTTDDLTAISKILGAYKENTCGGVRKSQLQGWSVRKKESFSQNITGALGKNVSKKTARSIRGMNFFLKLKVLIKLCNISHLMPCKLPCKFISWVSRNTKMPNCTFFLHYQSPWRQLWRHFHY